jgi:hypothetical protein
MNLLFRILTLPFIAAVIALYLIKVFIVDIISYLRHGGEYIIYAKGDKVLIKDIYDLIKKDYDGRN